MMQKTCRNAGLFLWADGGAGAGVGMTGDHMYPESLGLA